MTPSTTRKFTTEEEAEIIRQAQKEVKDRLSLPQLASDLASRIKDMAMDSTINNADTIQRLLQEVYDSGYRDGYSAGYGNTPVDFTGFTRNY